MSTSHTLPFAEREAAHVPGHWLLARLGKRVLRPGGKQLTTALLSKADIHGADVIELAPGLGRTAAAILALQPASYVGVEHDQAAADIVRDLVNGRGRCVVASAEDTALPGDSADVVVAEAMLTMQTDTTKEQIISEVFRVLRAGGRYSAHELALQPDNLADDIKTDIRTSLARSIKVNARPLTITEWTDLFERAGFKVEGTYRAPMALLQTRRLIADEGPLGAVRFVINVCRDRTARRRILDMRATFIKYKKSLVAVGIVATKPVVQS